MIDRFSEDVKTTSSKLDLGHSYSTYVTQVQLGFYYMIFKLNAEMLLLGTVYSIHDQPKTTSSGTVTTPCQLWLKLGKEITVSNETSVVDTKVQ